MTTRIPMNGFEFETETGKAFDGDIEIPFTFENAHVAGQQGNPAQYASQVTADKVLVSLQHAFPFISFRPAKADFKFYSEDVPQRLIEARIPGQVALLNAGLVALTMYRRPDWHEAIIADLMSNAKAPEGEN